MANRDESENDSGRIETPHWRWAAASQQGAGHIVAGTLCQDAHRVYELPRGILIAIVADGAGSASRSHDGSTLAVDTLGGYLAEALIPEETTEADLEVLLRRGFVAAYTAIKDLAEQNDLPISDFHTTLACAIVTRASVAIAHIGDGTIVCWDRPGELEVVARPDHGEFANSTFFVTELPQQLDHMHIRVMARQCQGVALTTDGLLEVAFEDSYSEIKPWFPFFEPLIERVHNASIDNDLSARMQAFLASPKIGNATNDDVTLIIAEWQEPVGLS